MAAGLSPAVSGPRPRGVEVAGALGVERGTAGPGSAERVQGRGAASTLEAHLAGSPCGAATSWAAIIHHGRLTNALKREGMIYFVHVP